MVLNLENLRLLKKLMGKILNVVLHENADL